MYPSIQLLVLKHLPKVRIFITINSLIVKVKPSFRSSRVARTDQQINDKKARNVTNRLNRPESAQVKKIQWYNTNERADVAPPACFMVREDIVGGAEKEEEFDLLHELRPRPR